MTAVVVGYVPKPEGEAALDAAIGEARLRGARILVVTSHHDDIEAQGWEDAIAKAKLRLDESGISYDVRHLVRNFEPAADLISIADAAKAELIVIGLRKRSPVGKLILGANAQQVLLDATCPVLTVKAATA